MERVFVVVEAFHEHGGELVCGAIVSVRRGRTVEVQFFFLKKSCEFRKYRVDLFDLLFFLSLC